MRYTKHYGTFCVSRVVLIYCIMNRLLAVSSRRLMATRPSTGFLAAPANNASQRRNMADIAFTFASPQQVN